MTIALAPWCATSCGSHCPTLKIIVLRPCVVGVPPPPPPLPPPRHRGRRRQAEGALSRGLESAQLEASVSGFKDHVGGPTGDPMSVCFKRMVRAHTHITHPLTPTHHARTHPVQLSDFLDVV